MAEGLLTRGCFWASRQPPSVTLIFAHILYTEERRGPGGSCRTRTGRQILCCQAWGSFYRALGSDGARNQEPGPTQSMMRILLALPCC